MATSDNIHPIRTRERFIILDALRGFALLGICLANFPEFSLYTFLKSDVVSSMPWAQADRSIRFFQYMLVDGKFYTMFSILFGIGFSIILSHSEQKRANGLGIFYRRMCILLIIGFLHLMFIWSGDILMLYALLGMLLPIFRHRSNKELLLLSALFLLFPVAADALRTSSGINPSAPVIHMQQYFCAKYGITQDNFAFWLRDAEHYPDVFKFLVQGAFVRIQEFIDGNRFFKVIGLFLLGFYIGKKRIYANLAEHRLLLKRTCIYGFSIGLPFSALYTWSAVSEQPWGIVGHSLLYVLGVFPLGAAYMAVMCLFYLHRQECPLFKILAAPGQMALTNYIGQSLMGMIIFYGIGFGLGASMGLGCTLLIAISVYLTEVLISRLWLRFFQFGPLEWIWRIFTYKKYFNLLK